jgi:predicted esterase
MPSICGPTVTLSCTSPPLRLILFVLYLHGATGKERQGIRRLSPLADEFGFLRLSPASQEGTWDAIRSGYGPDVRFIDQALAKVFAQRRVDPRKIAVCGFSDGASYALGLGISNGNLFRAVLAFSPGFVPTGVAERGNPRIFVSHGTKPALGPRPQAGRLQSELPGVRWPTPCLPRSRAGPSNGF